MAVSKKNAHWGRCHRYGMCNSEARESRCEDKTPAFNLLSDAQVGRFPYKFVYRFTAVKQVLSPSYGIRDH